MRQNWSARAKAARRVWNRENMAASVAPGWLEGVWTRVESRMPARGLEVGEPSSEVRTRGGWDEWSRVWMVGCQ